MRHLAAYLLLVAGGNETPSAEDVTNVLSQAGVEVDTERLETLIKELEGKNLAELVEAGKEKLMVGGLGGGAPAAGGAAPAAGAAAAPAGIYLFILNLFLESRIECSISSSPMILAAAAVPEKPKVEEVDALDGGMDMFGGGAKDY
jgi:large subunit ribosomal protein LP2